MHAERGYRLQEPLPPDVLTGGNAVFSRYRQYPVFGGRWLRGRTLVFSVVLAGLSLLTWLGFVMASIHWRQGVWVAGCQFVAFLLMTSAGPALATWVRHRQWPAARERIGVVLGWLIGVVLAFFVDAWASAQVEQVLRSAAVADAALPSLDVTLAPPAETASGWGRAVLESLGVLAGFAIYGVLGGGFALRAYFSERRRWQESVHRRQLAAVQQEKRDADVRLGVLQAQVEPHFLFNTLASVRALVRRDPERAEHTLDALVAHLRATIPKLRDGDVGLDSTLGQQLDICAGYLDVMRLRTGNRLSFHIEAAPALRALPYPPLLLLTLVENAVKHGIEPKPGAGRIDVQAMRDGGALRVQVSDDGAGLQPGIGSGTGLANVRAQLHTRFGARAALRLASREGGGTLAEILIPLEDTP